VRACKHAPRPSTHTWALGAFPLANDTTARVLAGEIGLGMSLGRI
jgi:hypothetical protein